MKLYEIPRNSRIRIKGLEINGVLTEEFNFHHVDGAYSLCSDDKGNTFHLSASTEIELLTNKPK